ncbi:glycopeptide [Dendrothele bispora CBS 962.96]|uniref:Glycopeptide n=1 Tax=Dendrothele bispora (strain CBS 962.96) TaxID=1314807 RepID=A0A4S8KZN7_DENBC|nr:glycopeptide [Dendrothele bispora CBS 962.96]
MFSSSLSLFATIGILIASAHAETHTVVFDNRCGFGTPTLIQGPRVLGTGNGPFHINGPLTGAIAYLQTGKCGFNGEGCTLVETTLKNPTCPGCGSSTDISLIPPHSFSVTSGFGYFNGCDKAGADCTNANCPTAFHKPSDTFVQIPCQADNLSFSLFSDLDRSG